MCAKKFKKSERLTRKPPNYYFLVQSKKFYKWFFFIVTLSLILLYLELILWSRNRKLFCGDTPRNQSGVYTKRTTILQVYTAPSGYQLLFTWSPLLFPPKQLDVQRWGPGRPSVSFRPIVSCRSSTLDRCQTKTKRVLERKDNLRPKTHNKDPPHPTLDPGRRVCRGVPCGLPLYGGTSWRRPLDLWLKF